MKSKSSIHRILIALFVCVLVSAAAVSVVGCGDDEKKEPTDAKKKKKKAPKGKAGAAGFGRFANKKPGKSVFADAKGKTPVKLLRTFDVPGDERVLIAVVACDAKHLLYATAKKVRAINVDTGKQVLEFDCPKGTPLALSPGGGHIIVLVEQKGADGSTTYKTSTVDLAQGKSVRSQLGHWGAAFFVDSGRRTFLIGRGSDAKDEDGGLLLCQRETMSTEVAKPEALPFDDIQPGWTAATTPTGKPLVLRTGGQAWLHFVGTTSKREAPTFGSHRAASAPAGDQAAARSAELVALAPDGRRLVTAGEETLRVLEANGQEVWRYDELRKMPGDLDAAASPLAHPQSGWSASGQAGRMDVLAVSPDGLFAVTAHQDGKLRVWGLPGPKDAPAKGADKGDAVLHEAATIVGAHAVALSPDGKDMVLATAGGPRIDSFRSVTGKAGTAVRAGSRWYAAATQMGTAMPKPDTRKKGAPAPAETAPVVVTQMQFFGDGKYVATNGRQESLAGADALRIWHASTKKLYGHADLKGPIDALAVAPDGKRIALSASTGEGVTLWSDLGDEAVQTAIPAGKKVTALAFSPDGKSLAASGRDADGGPVTALWSIETRKKTVSLAGHTAAVRQIVFSADGTLLATAGEDKTVRLWSAADGKCVATLKGHELPVTSVSISPDGKQVASAAGTHQDRGELKIWDVKKKSQLAEARGHRLGVRQVLFSPDGAWLLTAGCDATVKLWKLTKPAAVEMPKLTAIKGMEIWKDPNDKDAEKMLKQAKSWLKSKKEEQHQAAAGKLREIVRRQRGTPAAAEAARILKKGPATTKPATTTTKPAVASKGQEATARWILSAALKTAKSSKKGAKENALKQLRELVEKYPATKAAKTAEEHINEFAPPPPPVDEKEVKAKAAKKMLQLAEVLLANNVRDKGIAKLQQIVEKYPDTPAGIKAATLLKHLKGPASQPTTNST